MCVQAQNLPYPLLSDTDQLLRKSFGIKVRTALQQRHVGEPGNFHQGVRAVPRISGYAEVPLESQIKYAHHDPTASLPHCCGSA